MILKEETEKKYIIRKRVGERGKYYDEHRRNEGEKVKLNSDNHIACLCQDEKNIHKED